MSSGTVKVGKEVRLLTQTDLFPHRPGIGHHFKTFTLKSPLLLPQAKEIPFLSNALVNGLLPKTFCQPGKKIGSHCGQVRETTPRAPTLRTREHSNLVSYFMPQNQAFSLNTVLM